MSLSDSEFARNESREGMHTSAHCEIKNVREVSKLFEAAGESGIPGWGVKNLHGSVSIM
jgi:hypothetical protein